MVFDCRRGINLGASGEKGKGCIGINLVASVSWAMTLGS
jgi:hypothetical protein